MICMTAAVIQHPNDCHVEHFWWLHRLQEWAGGPKIVDNKSLQIHDLSVVLLYLGVTGIANKLLRSFPLVSVKDSWVFVIGDAAVSCNWQKSAISVTEYEDVGAPTWAGLMSNVSITVYILARVLINLSPGRRGVPSRHWKGVTGHADHSWL